MTGPQHHGSERLKNKLDPRETNGRNKLETQFPEFFLVSSGHFSPLQTRLFLDWNHPYGVEHETRGVLAASVPCYPLNTTSVLDTASGEPVTDTTAEFTMKIATNFTAWLCSMISV